jgi:hypothetical protein
MNLFILVCQVCLSKKHVHLEYISTLSLLHFSSFAPKVTSCVRIYISHYFESRCILLYVKHDFIKAFSSVQFTFSKLSCKLRYVGCKRLLRDWSYVILIYLWLFSWLGIESSFLTLRIDAYQYLIFLLGDKEFCHLQFPSDESHCHYTRHVHKVSFPLVPQLANLILREATALTW